MKPFAVARGDKLVTWSFAKLLWTLVLSTDSEMA